MRPALLVQALICALHIAAAASAASAHGGGLDSEGCHTNRKSGERHCHRGPKALKPDPRKLPARPLDFATPLEQRNDLDCADFDGSWRAAQEFYEAAGPGDPHRLDADKDGIACEWLLRRFPLPEEYLRRKR